MGLKQLIRALLPRDYREQVLGDLEERNFRLGDVASVLPGVWRSHLRRACEIPNLAGASEEDIQRRTHQLTLHRNWVLVWFAIFGASIFLDARRNGLEKWFGAFFVIAMLAALVARTFRRPAPPSESASQHLRTMLRQMRDLSKLGSPYFIVVIATSRAMETYLGGPVYRPLHFVGFAACFAYGQLRARRLQRELDTLA